MVFATVSYASYLFISTILNCLVVEVNKTISNYKLLLNYCLRRAMKERNMKSWLITQGVKNCFQYSILSMLLFHYPSPSSFHYAIGCWHFSLCSLYTNHYFHMLLSFIKATLALRPLSLISRHNPLSSYTVTALKFVSAKHCTFMFHLLKILI